ncbi:MAG: DUF1015 domain-containing protein, partial [Anaerolineae bacterium]|nr:DUF1015 domain-containing protein [Anaerolineae bacterium]
MATIRPFRGLRYNTAKVALSDVITQPYDRIHEAEQERYYALSPYSLVRIILGKRTSWASDTENIYTRARCYARTWLAEGILVLDHRPV